VIYFSIKISNHYHKYDIKTQQLVAFIYMANTRVRREESLLYNDQFMELLCVLGIYLMVKGWPLVSALLFSMAIGLKAGAVLYLPAVLGII
jgi:hypothetical protein